MNRYDLEEQCSKLYAEEFGHGAHRPLVGITANYGENTCKLAEGYYKQVIDAGGTPFIIPPTKDPQVMIETVARIDALLLTGGADINPLFQGEEPLPRLGAINDERDLPELMLTRLACNRQIPILGICRGIQTLAVALGGKVAQDLTELEGRKRIKHSQDAARNVATHTVNVMGRTSLFNIFKETLEAEEPLRLAVNSFHHQAVADTGPHLKVSATAPDGTIEAVESNEYKPIIGVQWHPECMGEDGAPLFKWLVKAARAYKQTKRLHDKVLTLDTHCDTPMFFPKNINFATRDPRILVDLPKMTEGRLDATIMVAYIPQTMEESAFDYANNVFDKIKSIVQENEKMLALARTPDELWQNKKNGRKSIMIGIENGKALEGNIDNLDYFAKRGIVYVTLCHNGDNDICDSAKGSMTNNGVSAFGEKVIHRMNELGIMVDMSHANEKSFYDALDISSKPIVCSHSSCRALCDHPRNLTDEQMRALAEKGGVCQITLYPGFLRLDEKKATIKDAIAHLEHAITIMGIDHVGLGTDFDGDGGVPGLADASEMTLFTRQLLMKRFNKFDIQKIWGGNFLRVMRQVQASIH